VLDKNGQPEIEGHEVAYFSHSSQRSCSETGFCRFCGYFSLIVPAAGSDLRQNWLSKATKPVSEQLPIICLHHYTFLD